MLRTVGAGATAAVIAVAAGACTGSSSSGDAAGPRGAAASSSPSNDQHATASSAASSASSPAASSAPPSATPAAASSDFPCDVFTPAEIKAATGYDVVKSKPITAVNDPTQHSCEWGDAQGHSFGILAATHDGQHALQIFSQVENTGSAISGFGDAAWGNDSEIGVVFGSSYVQVSDDSDANNDNATLANIGVSRLEQMATAVHARMG